MGWGSNTGYDNMPTSLGIVQTQIHCLGQGSVADKPHTSQCPSMSVADITDCTTSPAMIQQRPRIIVGDARFNHGTSFDMF